MLNRWIVIAMGLIALSGVASAEGAADYIGKPEAIAAGKTRFIEACSACHGRDGGGGVGPALVNDRGREVRRLSDERLFASIQKGVAGSDMPPFDWPEEQLWQVIAFVRNLSAPAIDAPPDGDIAAGREVFFGKGGCSNCHKIRGQGGSLGPDLTEAGGTMQLDAMRLAILEPNERIADGYTPVNLTLADGSQVKAVAKNYTNYSAQVIDGGGKLHLLRGKSLERMKILEKSWMPANYGERLSEHEFRDLVAFLSRQSARADLDASR